MVPDLWDIADGFAEAVSTLRKLAEERSAQATPPAVPQPSTAEAGSSAASEARPARKPRARTTKAAPPDPAAE
jgi:hypothetical protein